VHIKYLLATPPNMVHDPSGSRHGLKITALNCGRDKQVRHFHIFLSQQPLVKTGYQLIKMTFTSTNSSIGDNSNI